MNRSGRQPRTTSLEIPVKQILQGGDPRQVMEAGTVDNPDALRWFAAWPMEARA